MSLADQLAARAAKGTASFSDERAAVYAAQARAIEASGVADSALGKGDRAPSFELPNAVGEVVALAEVLAETPAIVSFYRGGWCPFCSLELRALQQEVESAPPGPVTLVAISPNTPDVTADTVAELELTFSVLSDRDNQVARSFGLVYQMISEMVELYRDIGRDIGALNGSEAWELPVPATYVIDQDGIIQYAFVELNHRVRAEPSEVMAVAAELAP